MTGLPCSPVETSSMPVQLSPPREAEEKLTGEADFFSVADKYDILPHCQFNAMCLSLIWDDYRSLWMCTFQDTISGEVYKREAPVVVSAIGTLDRPHIPNIEGFESFQGKIFHSARWDDTFQSKDKNVVVLGNGASATQFVPELVSNAGKGKVTQFVRSAHWWTKRVSSSDLISNWRIDRRG